MAKKITMQQRLVAFGLEAVSLELNAAIETLQAIRNSRFPKQAKTARKPRADKGSRRTQPPPPATVGEPAED